MTVNRCIGSGSVRARGPWLTGRAPQLLLLIFVAASAVFARTTLGSLQEGMRIQLSLSDDQIALIQGPALVLPALAFGWYLGHLVDHRSRVHLVLALAIIAVFGSALTALASGFSTLFAARSLVGLSSYGIPITATSLISDLYERNSRGRANMWLAIGEIGAMAAAFGIGGALLQGTGQSDTEWRSAMGWLTLPLAFAPLAACALAEPKRTERKFETQSLRAGFIELWGYRGLLGALLAGLAMVGVADGAAVVWVAPTLVRIHHLPPGRVGEIIATAMFVGGTLGPIFGGVLVDFCRRTGGALRTLYLLCAFALVSAVCALFGVSSGVTTVAALLTAFLAVGGAINVTVMAVLTTDIPNELRGLAVSSSITASLLFGFGIAPLSVSMLSGLLGGPSMIGCALTLICGGTSAIGIAAFGFGARQLVRR